MDLVILDIASALSLTTFLLFCIKRVGLGIADVLDAMASIVSSYGKLRDALRQCHLPHNDVARAEPDEDADGR